MSSTDSAPVSRLRTRTVLGAFVGLERDADRDHEQRGRDHGEEQETREKPTPH